MQLSDFDFTLPNELIATRPVTPRSDAKLLVSHGTQVTDAKVGELTQFLNPGDRLVLNDTKVIPARLFGTRTRMSQQGEVQAKIEVTLIEALADGTWRSLIKPLRKLQVGEVVVFSPELHATCVNKTEGEAFLDFACKGAEFDLALDQTGHMPLPPYIAAQRPADARDKQDYQTVWAKNSGAVAAPTASLHLDHAMLDQLRNHGVQISFVTLHVGAGTFLPVKVEDVTRHKMHAEWGEVTANTVDEIESTRASGGRIIPVGTTALRLLETAGQSGQLQPFAAATDIFIYPGFTFNVCDGLMTNFHLPKSTLLMLVSALIGKDQVDRMYAHAIENRYRFFSYGDASLLFPN